MRAAEQQFGATGLRSTTAGGIAKAARTSEAAIYTSFGTKQRLFEEVVRRNTQNRVAVLRERFQSIPALPPLECVEKMAEATVLACVDETANAAVMAWALMEMPEFGAELYREEIGATEALWGSETGTRLADSPLRRPLAVHVVPYAVHTCMAFGFWLATLHHKPATAEAHARQYAGAVVQVARVVMDFVPEPVEPAA